MSYPLRSFPGAALAGTLQTAITNASTTFTSSTSLSTWSDITGNNWAGYVCIAMEYGTAYEEKILCSYTSATQTFTIVQRGYDGTGAVNHTAGSLFVPVFTATEAGELNNVTQSLSGMLSKTGTSTTPGDTHLNSSSVGSSKFPAYADHYHSITDSTLNTWLGSTASATLPSAVHVPTTNLDAGALPGGVTVPAGQVTSGSLSSSVAVALASLVSGALPTAVTVSNVWNPTPTTSGTGPTQSGVTGYNKYIVVAWSKETTSASGNDQLGLSITCGTTTGINPVLQTTTTSANSTVVTFAYYVPASSSTSFSVSSVVTHNNPANVTSQTHNLIVIGLN